MYAPETERKDISEETAGREHIVAIAIAGLILVLLTTGPLLGSKMHDQIEGSAVQSSLRNLSSPFFNKPPPTKQRTTFNSSGYNYALSSCGAKVLFSSKGAAHSSAILNSNMDAYMIVDCSHIKEAQPSTAKGKESEEKDYGNGVDPEEAWVIIELCQAIRTDGIEISNFELFSAQFKNFSVYGSFNSPGQDSWVLLGNFITNNVLQSQKFSLLPVWCRYIRISVHSHWGNERFCTLSSVKIFGSSLVEDMITWQEENTNKIATEGEQNPSQQQMPPDPDAKETVNKGNDDDNDDDVLENLSEGGNNGTSYQDINISDFIEDTDEVEVIEEIITTTTMEEDEDEDETEDANKEDPNNSTAFIKEDKNETLDSANSEQNNATQEDINTEQNATNKTKCTNCLLLFDHEFVRNYVRTSTENTTFFSLCEEYDLEDIFLENDTKENNTSKKVPENSTEGDKQTENATKKKLFTPQLPFDKLKLKYSTLEIKVKELNEMISSLNNTLQKLKYKNKVLKAETRINNTLATRRFDELVSELLTNATKTSSILASIYDEIGTLETKIDFYEEYLEVLETNMTKMEAKIAALFRHFILYAAILALAFTIVCTFLIFRTRR